jgi:plastocyanin
MLLFLLIAANVTGKVTVMKDGKPKADNGNVVVYLSGVPNAAPAAPKGPPPEIKQKDLAFEPMVNVVVVGTTIEFPNEDKIFHNVFSVSEAAKFDLGLYRSGEKKAVTFKKPGVVDVYCNIHPEMVAKIKVLDTKYYAISAKDGSFTITNVPPGTHDAVAWQAFGEEAHTAAVVRAGDDTAIAFTLEEGPKKRHLRKDGTPYGRYK